MKQSIKRELQHRRKPQFQDYSPALKTGIISIVLTILAGCDLSFNSATEKIIEGGVSRLGHDLTVKSFPSWSPDGLHIVYSARYDSTVFSSIALSNQSDNELLTIDQRVEQWQFTRDGSMLAYTVQPSPSTSELNILNMLTGEALRIPISGRTISLNWSPDNRWLSQGYTNNGAYILIWNASWQAVSRITTNGGSSTTVGVWSPNGNKLACTIRRSANEQIGVWQPDKELELITPDSIRSFTPQWSPDGQNIVFQFVRLGSSGDQIGAWSENKGFIPITPDSMRAYYPVWFFTEERILFLRNDLQDVDNRLSLWSIRSDGSDLKLFSNEATFNEFAWSPDGSVLAAEGSGGTYFLNPEGFLIKHFSARFDPIWYGDQMALAHTNIKSDSKLTVFSLKDSVASVISETALQSAPSWLPDGDNLIFESSNSFYNLNVRNSEQTRIQIDPIVSRDDPALSPDGKWLAYSDANGIVVARFGQKIGSATTLFGPYSDPCWGPDNASIAVVNNDLGGITIIGLSDGKMTNFQDLHEGWDFRRPTWSLRHTRVGSRIAAETGGGLYVFSADTTERPFRLVNSGTQLSWSPDASQIAFVRNGQIYIADSFTAFTED